MNKIKYLLFTATVLILSSSIFLYVFLENDFLIRKWTIPLSPPGFRDAQQIGIAAESSAGGYDPMTENLFTSEGYQGLNYPRIWHILFAMGIDQSHTNLIGSIFAVLFFAGAGVFWFSRKFDNLTYIIMSVLFLSPPVMLGLERGNIEVVVFFVLAVALWAYHYSTIYGFILFLLASLLKLYPVFAFVAFIKERKKTFWTLFVSACVIFTFYVLFTIDLEIMYTIQPKLAKSSHGLNVFWMGLNHPRLLNLHVTDRVMMTVKILSYIAAALIFAGSFVFGLKSGSADRLKPGEHLDSFRAGACIYIGCFLLGNNFDYRLIFLIFTVPQLTAWLRDREYRISAVPLITLLAMVFSLWSFFITRILGQKATFVLEELSNWTILACLLYLIFASLPGWLNEDIRRPFSQIKGIGKTGSGRA